MTRDPRDDGQPLGGILRACILGAAFWAIVGFLAAHAK